MRFTEFEMNGWVLVSSWSSIKLLLDFCMYYRKKWLRVGKLL